MSKTKATPETPVKSENTKTGFVQIGQHDTQVHPKRKLSDAINRTSLTDHVKKELWGQVYKGTIEPKYWDTVQSILIAESQGTVHAISAVK